uniref:Uncharacterized protein n=1 Tax=Pseudomonas fluorescens (strain SBW25) TaxID=216595 RepID=A0A0G4E519_PSEFS|nr:hypothetical protein PQBR57_0145 [Pseudomonas fluorescens SBW25]
MVKLIFSPTESKETAHVLSRLGVKLTGSTVIEGAVRTVPYNYFDLGEDQRPA